MDSVHLQAEASGNARIYQAGRDQHLHFRDGVRATRRADSAGVPGECPYPGLASFTSEQARWFFGRDQVTADLVGRVSDSLTEGGMLMVVGASGTGKSSLIHAGLLPALARGAIPATGSRNWPRVVFNPTAHPLRKTAARLVASSDGAVPVTDEAQPGADRLTSMLRQLLRAHMPAGPAGRAVIVVDQFEELFTLCEDEDERQSFIGWLWQIATQGDQVPLALVVCGLRADFYANCVSYPQLRQALQANQVLVGPMSQDELREVILFPAEASGLDIEPGLAELLLRDLGSQSADGGAADDYDAGRLPHLAHALQVTWQQRHGSLLTVDGYLATGGIGHAIAVTAERDFSLLDGPVQQEARTVFLRLVKIADVGEDVRRPVSRESLLAGTRRPSAVQKILDVYTQNRLLTQTTDTVQITHEALIRAWPRLREWIDTDRIGNLTRQEIEEAAAIWSNANRDRDALHRGNRLEQERRWATPAHQDELSPVGAEFLTASIRQERRASGLQRAAVASLALLTVLALIATGFALRQTATVRAERDNATFGQITAEAGNLPGTNVSLAAQLDIAAFRMRRTAGTYDNLLSMAARPLSTPAAGDAGPVYAVAFNRDSQILATATDYGEVQLWNVADPAHPVLLGKPLVSGPRVKANLGHADIIYGLAFNPDGKILAAASDSGEIRLWDVVNPARPRSLQLRAPSPGVGINAVAFSPDGVMLASGASNGTIQVWNLAASGGPAPVGPATPTGDGDIYSLEFSPAGDILASGGGDGKIRLWKVTSHAPPSRAGPPVTAGTQRINSLAFYPNGNFLVSGSSDLHVRLWDVSTPGHPFRLSSVSSGVNPVYAVAVSPDGRVIASSNGSGVQLWSFDSNKGLVELGSPLTGDTEPVETMEFSPDGHLLATGSDDGTIRLWTIPSGLLVSHSSVRSMAYSPGGGLLVSGYQDGTMQLWKPPGPAGSGPAGAAVQDSDGSPVDSVAYSPAGQVVADGSGGGIIQLWKASAQTGLTPLGRPIQANAGVISSVAFSPDGKLLAIGSDTGAIRLWNLANPAAPVAEGPPTYYVHGGAVESVAFSRDGHTLADGTASGSLQTWHVTASARITLDDSITHFATLTVGTIAFSPHNDILASGGQNDAVQLWNISNPRKPVRLGRPLLTTNYVFSVAFSPDGHTLAAGADDGTVSLWNVANPAKTSRLGQLRLTASTSFSAIASVAFSPNGHSLAVGSFDNSIRIVPLGAAEAIHTICTEIPDVLTRALWDHYISALSYNPPCRTAGS